MFGKRAEFAQYKFLVDGLSDEILKRRVETSLRFSLIVTVTAGVSAHFKYSEKMQNYRNLAESMKSEVAMYECRAQKYSREKTENEEQAKDIFLQSIEKIIEDGYRKSKELETKQNSIAENRG